MGTEKEFGKGDNLFGGIRRCPKLKQICLLDLCHPADFQKVKKPKENITAIGAIQVSKRVNAMCHPLIGQILGYNIAVIKDLKDFSPSN